MSDSLCRYLTNYIEKLKKLSFYSEKMYIFSRLDYARTENEKLDPFSLKTFTNHIRAAYIHAGLIEKDGALPRNHVARHAFNTMIEKHREIADSDRKAYLGHSDDSGVNGDYTHTISKEARKIAKIADKFCGKFVDEDL